MPKIVPGLVFVTTLGWDVLVCQGLRRQNWWDKIEPDLILGAFPTRSSVKRLHDMGVRAIVNMCAEFSGPKKDYAKSGIDQLRIPTIDFTEPSVAEIQQAIGYINQHRGTTGSVYVHCKSGRGRSATVVLCWLMQHYKLSPEAAQQRLQPLRGQVLKNLFQRQCVQQFLALNSNSSPENKSSTHRNSEAVR